MKTLKILIGLLLIFPLILGAQTAPDFTITTTHNETVELYADHLDQGQTVLLEIMFTTCPPCNSIAPDMEPLYQSWGGGDGDVEFFSLSNKSFDSNADVAAYEDDYGMTFPGAGEDGGSLEAVAPYQSGQFGPFFGTPTFVVISPDGSVQFDVKGGNNQQTIDSIDAAIAATGAERPGSGDDPPDTVDFTVEVLQPDLSSPMEGVTVRLVDANSDNEVLETGTTPGNGSYTFKDIVVDSTASYAVSAQQSGTPLNGVSTYDIVLIQRFLLGLDQVNNALKIKSMDANGDGSQNALDILDVRKVILGIFDEFSGGAPWIFVGLNGPDNVVDLPQVFPEPGETNQSELTIYGIKRADVSGTINPF